MKIKTFVLATVLLSLPALGQEVDQAEVQRIVAAHPDYARWLADPKLAQLTLAGPKMPGSPYNVDDIRRPQPARVDTGTACPSRATNG